MYGCDCGDYCAYCHPEMCGYEPLTELEKAKEILREIARRVKRIEESL